MTAPRFCITAIERFGRPYRLRLPFRYGAATVTHGRQAVLHAQVRLEDGRTGWGVAAEALAARWFDKDPALTEAQDPDQLRRSMAIAIGGTAPHAIVPGLGGFDFAALLAGLRQARRILARHTVGLVDPVTGADQAARVGDGLPETVEEVAQARGHRWWTLKVSGDAAADLDRLCRIAAVLDARI